MHEEPRPSARVRLEVAFLEDADAPAAAPTARDGPPGLTVLVVAAEADVRRYIGECLRTRTSLRVCEASSIRLATDLVGSTPLDLAIVDHGDGLQGLSHLRMIVIVDEVRYGAATVTPRIRLLNQPFSAEELWVEVDQLLREEQ